MKHKFNKLNSSGFAHHIVAAIIVIAVAIGGTYAVLQSHAASNPYPCAAPRPTIEEGSTGNCVKFAQWQLTYIYHYSTQGIDGDFGPNTRAAVVNFQSHNGLTADGIVGPLTWAKVGGVASTPPAGQSLPHDYSFAYNTPGIGHESGVACEHNGDIYDPMWCSNALSGGTSRIMWFGPYLTLPGTYSNTEVQINFRWQNRAHSDIYPSRGDTFTTDVTDNSGATRLYSQTVSGSGNGGADCSDSTANCDEYFSLPNNIPINKLEIRIYNVAAPNANGDILYLDSTELYNKYAN